MKILLVFVLLLSFEITTAQSVDVLEEKLTNGNHQKWKLTEIDGEPDEPCDRRIYDFYINKTLVRTICDRREEFNWIITSNDYRKYITFNRSDPPTKIEYEIQFVRKNNANLLRLRIADLRNFKQTTDYYFQEIND